MSHLLHKNEILHDTYEVLHFLGEGAFGEVYRVRHKFMGVQVLKLFKEAYSRNMDLSRIANEALILSQLTHKNIVRVFEANSMPMDGQDFFYVTMEFISGETLRQLLARRIELEREEAVRLALDYLRGLGAAHSHSPSILHRDISPDNVMICYDDPKPSAKLCDFGLAQSFDTLSAIPEAAGKLIYFAPECFWNAYLPASDVFSAGIVLYRTLTGIHPWQYDLSGAVGSQEETASAIRDARRKAPTAPSLLNPTVDKDLDRVIMKALSTDLEERYTNAGAFLSDLQEEARVDAAAWENNQ